MSNRNKLKKLAVIDLDLHMLGALTRKLETLLTPRLHVRAKREYFTAKFDKTQGDVKDTWRVINQLLGKSRGPTSVKELFVNDVSISDSSEIADEFNRYFSEVGLNLAGGIRPAEEDPEKYLNSTNLNAVFQPISESHIYLLLGRLSASISQLDLTKFLGNC